MNKKLNVIFYIIILISVICYYQSLYQFNDMFIFGFPVLSKQIDMIVLVNFMIWITPTIMLISLRINIFVLAFSENFLYERIRIKHVWQWYRRIFIKDLGCITFYAIFRYLIGNHFSQVANPNIIFVIKYLAVYICIIYIINLIMQLAYVYIRRIEAISLSFCAFLLMYVLALVYNDRILCQLILFNNTSSDIAIVIIGCCILIAFVILTICLMIQNNDY